MTENEFSDDQQKRHEADTVCRRLLQRRPELQGVSFG